MGKRIFWSIGILFLFIPYILFSQPSATAVRIDQAPVIDGSLSDDVWLKASPISDLVQREPNTNAPVSEKTELFILFDDNYLYLGIRCYDDPEKVIGREMARNANLSNDDRVQIILDTHHDKRNAYWFQIGPGGSVGDAVISSNGQGFNKEWQGLWDGRAVVTAYGWEAEIAIPFKTLNFSVENSVWGLKFIRYIQRKLEISTWPATSLNAHRFQVSDAGLLTGLEGISQGLGIDIKPWLLGGYNNPHTGRYPFMGDGGLDVFYQVTPGLKSVLTINTDFAETEADNRQINLTRFSLHFPEKRDFFLDGANYFDFGIGGEVENRFARRVIPFFSRRLGLDANGSPLSIHGGARLTGQFGDWNIGLLNILQERQFDNSNYSAMRVSRNLGNQSSVGMVATLGNAVSTGNNGLYGLDARLATSTLAGDKNLALTLYGMQSITTQQVFENLSGNALGLDINYPNDLFFGRVGYVQIDEDFNAGIGFVPRKGIREYYARGGFAPRPDWLGILQTISGFELDHISGIDGTLQTREFQIVPVHIRFKTGEELKSGILFTHENLIDEFMLLNRVLIPAGKYDFIKYSMGISSAKSRNLWAAINADWGTFYSGDNIRFDFAAGWQVFPNLFLSSKVERNYLTFADESLEVGVYSAIVNVLFNPRVNLFVFAQYDDISETMGWQSRFHWIIKPGREILFVWNSIVADPLSRFTITDNGSRLKIKYNIRF